MSLVGFKARNHRQQVGKRGPNPKVDERQTSPEVFDPLHERFRFTVDAAALPRNAKLPRFYAPADFVPRRCMWDHPAECGPGGCLGCEQGARDPKPIALDALAQSWAGERVWCNPPYSDIEPWVAKAHGEWLLGTRPRWGGPEVIVMLVPANRTEQGWWQRQVEPYLRERRSDFRVEFLPGRLRFIAFDADEIKPNERPPFGCAPLIWGAAA